MSISEMINLYEITTGSCVDYQNGVYTISDFYVDETIDEQDFEAWITYQLTEELKAQDFTAVDDISGEKLSAEFITCKSAVIADYDYDNNVAYIAM